ncbi:MAG: HAD family hydrolase [Promethearchaeota archaeon]
MARKFWIIWDWNGTLIDDVDISLECINTILKKSRLPTIDRDNYQEIFTFPVKDYYKKLGFDFTRNSFTELADMFIDEYKKRMFNAKLFPDVRNVLEFLQQMGAKQFVISAMEIRKLRQAIENKGILHYFEAILGLGNDYAKGKLDLIKKFAADRKSQLNSKKIWMIGDTVHDFYIADKLKWNSILVSQGHYSFSRLNAVGKRVVRNLDGVLNIFRNKADKPTGNK